MKRIKSQRGFSLIEVVASIVLISIILLSFAQIFVQANSTANINNEKLVVINLADAYLERLKATGLEEKRITTLEDYFKDYPKTVKIIDDSKSPTYTVSIKPSNTNVISNAITTEINQNKINIVVTVTSSKKINNRIISSTTEGYVQIEKK